MFTIRNIKDAEERKEEIINVAQELFVLKGYENTSTNDILEKVGIARGTLYYHFKSKEEILDAIISRIIKSTVENIKNAVFGKETAQQKIIAFICAMKVDSDIGKEITDYSHKPQNALMHQKIQTSFLSAIIPTAVDLINEGIKQGDFSTDYPEEAMEMILTYSSVAFDGINEMIPSEREKKISGFVFNMERLLGMEAGALSAVFKYI